LISASHAPAYVGESLVDARHPVVVSVVDSKGIYQTPEFLADRLARAVDLL
jgi:hypothetical protein